MPTFVHISEAKLHDSKVLANIRLNADSILAIDKAYNDYAQFARWTEDGVYFVTRMKDNALYTVVEERDVPQNRNITSDEIIVLTGTQAEQKCPKEKLYWTAVTATLENSMISVRMTSFEAQRYLAEAQAKRNRVEQVRGVP